MHAFSKDSKNSEMVEVKQLSVTALYIFLSFQKVHVCIICMLMGWVIVGQGCALAKLLLEHLHLPPVTRARLCPHDRIDRALKLHASIFKCLENRIILYLNELGYSEIDLLPGAVRRMPSTVGHSLALMKICCSENEHTNVLRATHASHPPPKST